MTTTDAPIFEDIYRLSPPEMLTLIDTLYARVENPKKDHSQETIEQMPYLSSFVEDSIREMAYIHMKKIVKRSFQLQVSDEIKFKTWNDYLSSIKEIFKMISFFSPTDAGLFIKKSKIIVKMRVSDGFAERVSPENIFPLLKVFLSKKILPTYSFSKSKNELKLEFNYYLNDSDDCIALPLKDNLNGLVSSELMKYMVSEDQIKSIGNHLCLLISDDTTLMQFNNFPEHLRFVEKKRIFFLFPFLFRPISIIIELSGNYFPTSQLSLTHTGSGEYRAREQDVINKNQKFYKLDFFNYFFQ